MGLFQKYMKLKKEKIFMKKFNNLIDLKPSTVSSLEFQPIKKEKSV